MESLSAHVVRLGCAASAEEIANPRDAAAAGATRHMVRCFPGLQRRFLSAIAEKTRRFARRMKFRASVRYDNARPKRRFRRGRSCARGRLSRAAAVAWERCGQDRPWAPILTRMSSRTRARLKRYFPRLGPGGANRVVDVSQPVPYPT